MSPALSFALTHVREFLAARTAVDQLEDALIATTFDMHRWAGKDVTEPLEQIERALWRYGRGDIGMKQLRDTLQEIVNDHVAL